VPLPEGVRRSIAERLERLPDITRHLAGVAAVVGRECSFELLHRASALTERDTADGLEELVRRRMLEAVGDHFDFTHDRVRRVALERLFPAMRDFTHRAVAEALERIHAEDLERVEDRLAHHYEQAGIPGKAIVYLRSCAETARNRFALDEALRLLDRALGQLERMPAGEREGLRLDLVVRKAYALSLAGRFPEARDLLLSHREPVERLDSDEVTGPYCVRLGMVQSYLGAHTEAVEAARRALGAAERCGDELSLGLAHHVLAATAYWTAVPREGVEHAGRAVELLSRRPRAEEWLALAHYLLGAHLHMLGLFDRALAAFARTKSLGQAIGNARVQAFALFGRGCTLADQGDYERALADCRRAIDIARDPFTRASAQAMTGYVQLEQGDHDAARSLLEQALEGFRTSGNRRMERRWIAILGEAELLGGHVERARQLAAEALENSLETKAQWHTARARRTLGQISVAAGDVSGAVAHLRAALETFTGIGAGYEQARTRLLLGQLCHAAGDRAEAAEQLSEASALFRTLDGPRWAMRAQELARWFEPDG
jgi:tetratricopeptide (TPR) repeat protein